MPPGTTTNVLCQGSARYAARPAAIGTVGSPSPCTNRTGTGAPPNGETWEAFHARVDRAWALVQDTAARTEGHLAVVTHGLVCRSLAARHLVLPAGEEAPTAWGNTALTIIDHPAPWRVRLLNCIAHLDDLEGQPIQDSGAV